MYTRVKILLALTSILLLSAAIALGQTTGSLEGVVKDNTGAAITGASVKITNSETGQSRLTQTNSDGFYKVTNLQFGLSYQVEVSVSNFEVKLVKDVAVRIGTGTSVNIELSVKGVAEQVTVTSDAELLNSTESQLSTSYSQKQVQQLPFGGGGIDNLALLTPGVIAPPTPFSNGVGISANGNRGRSNNFQLDGQDNNDNSVAGPSLTLTNQDAVGDYQITTNNPSAEFGRNAGAQINAITKAGTNRFHGTISNYIQDSKLNTFNLANEQTGQAFDFLARNGFSQLRDIADRKGKSPFSLNRLGGSIGGPIKKDKAFFSNRYYKRRVRWQQLKQRRHYFYSAKCANCNQFRFSWGNTNSWKYATRRWTDKRSRSRFFTSCSCCYRHKW
jgi:hypothetical protein